MKGTMPIPTPGAPTHPTPDADLHSPYNWQSPPLELRILAAPTQQPRDLRTRVVGVIVVFILSWLWAPWLKETPRYALGRMPSAQDLPATIRPTFERAVNGDAGAMRLLGSMYSHGLTVPQDTEEGLRWYRRAAAAGDAQAARELERLGLPENEDAEEGP
jgi:hypothetical protein